MRDQQNLDPPGSCDLEKLSKRQACCIVESSRYKHKGPAKKIKTYEHILEHNK